MNVKKLAENLYLADLSKQYGVTFEASTQQEAFRLALCYLESIR